MSVWRFASFIAPVGAQYRISLGEGNTPLVRSHRIGPEMGLPNLYFKLETANPSGSYKDRFAAVAVSAMLEAGKRRCVGTSSGNTGAALAAYCAAANIPCELAIVETAPTGKLSQMLAYGAQLKRVRGFGVDPAVTEATFARLSELGEHPETALQISAYLYSPVGMSGVETIGHELAERARAESAPIDHVFVPAGGGGLTLAVVRGFEAAHARQEIERIPRVHCVQPAGNDTIAGPLRAGERAARAVACRTAISGLQVPSVIDGDAAIAACRRSGGAGYLVEDDDVWNFQARLAHEEGILAEPAGAIALAGMFEALRLGEIENDSAIVCLVTGSGFKDAQSLERMAHRAIPLVEWEAL